jgi:hypothetical protein
MGFVKPTISKTRSVTDTRQENGRVINPPNYLELGGLKNASKIKKNKMTIQKPEAHGPFTRG